VANPKKNAGTNSLEESGLSFEAALQKLESVVEAMESEDLPLESLIKHYEEGVKLAQVCQGKLGEAELKISQLEKGSAGEFKLKPLAADTED